MTDWQILHTYRRLAERKKVEPLVCSADGDVLVLVGGHDDEPLLKCYSCQAEISLGQNDLRELKEKIDRV